MDITRISKSHISILLEARVTSSGKGVVVYVLCMLMWPWPNSRSRSLSFWNSENCTSLGLYPPSFWSGAQSWWLIAIVWNLVYSLSKPDFWISFSMSYQVTATSRNVDMTGHSNGHISLLLEARVTLLGVLVVYVLCILIWPWPDPRSKSRLCTRRWLSAPFRCLYLWPPYVIGQAIYIFILSYVLLSSFFFSFLA